jgi:hypothetical protein
MLSEDAQAVMHVLFEHNRARNKLILASGIREILSLYPNR